MCRCTAVAGGEKSLRYAAFMDPLRIRAFYIRLSLGPRRRTTPAPEKMTLVYSPPSDGGSLEVNDEWILPCQPAAVELRRVRSAEFGSDLVYGSTDRICSGEGVSFEAYVGEEPAVKGRFRRCTAGGWRMECWRATAREQTAGIDAADICVAGEDKIVMLERVEMGAGWRRGRRFCSRLEDIPEETGEEEREGRCDCCSEEEEDGDWQLLGKFSDDEEDERESEGMAWAVDLGICAACLGVGLLLSRASSSSARRRRFLPF